MKLPLNAVDVAAPAADRSFEATLSALTQLDGELIAARATLIQQQQEIEQLRAAMTAIVRSQEAAMSQVRRAAVMIKDVSAHAAQVETTLEVERSERLRLSDEMALITKHVGVLLGVLPTRTPSIAHNYQAMDESLVGIPQRPAT